MHLTRSPVTADPYKECMDLVLVCPTRTYFHGRVSYNMDRLLLRLGTVSVLI